MCRRGWQSGFELLRLLQGFALRNDASVISKRHCEERSDEATYRLCEERSDEATYRHCEELSDEATYRLCEELSDEAITSPLPTPCGWTNPSIPQ